MEQWRRNNVAASLTVFMLTAGFSFTIPFLPLYLEEVAPLTPERAALWAGVATALGGVGAFFSGPLWGILGDRFGRKPMLVRAALGGALGLLAIGLATATWQVVLARFWVGVMGGSPAASMALVTAGTPDDQQSRWLANLQASSLAGLALGPVLGAGLIQWLDFRPTFVVTSSMMAIGALATQIIVREDRSSFRPSGEAAPASGGAGLMTLLRSPRVRTTFALVAGMGLGVAMIQPVLAGYVKTIVAPQNVNLTVGMLYFGISATGASASFIAGRLMLRVSVNTIAVGATIAAGALLVPQGWTTAMWQLAPLVLGMAFFNGAVQAAIVKLVAGVVPREQIGAGFGVYQSIRAASLQMAPALGGVIAAGLGFVAVFPTAGIVMLIVGTVSAVALRDSSQPVDVEPCHMMIMRK